MRVPTDRTWQKNVRIFCRSELTDRAKQNCALTNVQLVKQALRRDVSLPTHQGISEPMHNIDYPNPLRVPTCDLIDYSEYKASLQESLNTATSEYTRLMSDLKQSNDGVATSAPAPAVTNPQQ